MNVVMELSHEEIERITSEKLRSLNCERFSDRHIYDEDFIEVLNEDDEISNGEMGFMSGYLGS